MNESHRAAVPLLVVCAVAAVDIHRPRFLRLAADDVHHTADGIRTVEGRGGSLDDLDALHIIQIQAAVIHVVERFARQTLPVDEEQHRVAAEARHVERRLLVHRIGEFDAREFGLQQIADMGGVRALDIQFGDNPCHDRGVFQQLGRAGSRDHYLVECHRVFFEPEIQGAVMVGGCGPRLLEITDICRCQRVILPIGQLQFVTTFGVRHRTELRKLLDENRRTGQRFVSAFGHRTGYPALGYGIDREEYAEQQKECHLFHHSCTGYR